jgi:1A family penicillin-binding protein
MRKRRIRDFFSTKRTRLNWKFWKWKKRQWFKFILYTIGIILGILILMIAWFSKDLPTPTKLKNLKAIESTQFFDRNGNRLYSATGEKMRIVIEEKDIPELMKKATISAEDSHFYTHHGLDFRGIFRGVILRPLTGKSTQGGSTITQQFVKNALLSPKRNVIRKIKEAILAVELEIFFSKEQILTMYLNEIPYGSNAYGVEAASQIYFSKHVNELNLSEIATLAALPQAPTYYSPYGTNTKELFARRDWVLKRMNELGHINDAKYEQAKNAEITFKRKKENILAPHFVMYAKQAIVEKYGDRIIEEGGYKVYTTLNIGMQRDAEQAISDGAANNLARYGAKNAAMVAIDPKTSEILAMVGSKDYFDLENDGNVNVTTSERSPGSSFKPIVYATGFKDKWNPASTLFDLKTDFGGGYVPQNYSGGFWGPVSIRESLGNSLNIPAVKMMGIVGIDKVINTAKDMGITTLNKKNDYGLSLAIGGGSTKLIEMTGAFGVFANEGKKANITPILKVIDEKGKTIFENKSKEKQVLDKQIAYQISNILSDNNARSRVFGFANYLNIAGKTTAVKTGTSQDYRDAHTIGYTPSLVAGVWVGNNDNSPMPGQGSASMASAPIWHQFMTSALSDTPNEDFKRPDGIKDMTVDALTGLLPTDNAPLGIRRDIFASWQIPNERADIYNTVKIDKSCGDKLAADSTPAELIEERTYANIHSEMPKLTNWEGPVRAWASGANLGSIAPTEYCDIHSSANIPSVKIVTPKTSQSVTGNTKLSISASAPLGINKVEYSIDGVIIGTSRKSPWSYYYDMDKLSSGVHRLSVRLIDNGQFTANNSVDFTVNKDTSAPGEISWTSGASGAGSGKISLGWANPTTSDLSRVHIYRGTSALNLTEVTNQSAAGNNQSYVFAGLLSGQKYYFMIKTEDSSSNMSSGSSVVSAICP